MEETLPVLAPSQIAARVADRFRVSGESGSRLELESREEIVEDAGVPFVVRVLAPRWGEAAARAKDAAARAAAGASAAGAAAGPAPRSPFLPPYDPALLVGAVTPAHVVLLNKYNIVDRHLLIVTAEFEPQESALTSGDLEAAWICLEALDGLVFYNSGVAAGASQSHKHLQLVPFPLGPRDLLFPLERAVAAALDGGLDRVPELDLRHRLVALDERRGAPPRAYATYRELVADFDLDRGAPPLLAPYNLLMTRRWLLMLPRSSASTGPIDVNALGFAGTLIAHDDRGLAAIREAGPREILRRVSRPWPAPSPAPE